MEYLEYLETAWLYLPYIFYTFVFLTLIPKSLSKINQFAKADYEANRNKWHRCYAPDICCHNLGESGEALPKQKPRKAVTRVYPKKQAAKQEVVTNTHAPIVADEPANIYKRQVHTHTNVNKIAKMFENGGVQKKINRVTPTVLPSDFRRCSMDFDDEESYHKKEDYSSNQSHESPLKKENVVLRRLSKLSQELEENNENSSNILNQMSHEEHNDLHNTSWRSEPITIQRRKRQVPSGMLMLNGLSATPSTVSPAHSSPLSSPRSCNSPVPCSSPLLRNAPVLNMNTSLEDLFVAIAKSAENSDGFLYAGCTSVSPVTSIDDILSQRRLSRPLSAYSISDLLNEEPNKGMDESYVENFLKVLNTT
ncbi:uncharacterized protein LOC135954193 [Calliphora vicina]|uniref:uncharacterized protein LOC135954193 n=1 Tax=Calliphora vicina TaxID=7373 RepID=UPI00325B4D46